MPRPRLCLHRMHFIICFMMMAFEWLYIIKNKWLESFLWVEKHIIWVAKPHDHNSDQVIIYSWQHCCVYFQQTLGIWTLLSCQWWDPNWALFWPVRGGSTYCDIQHCCWCITSRWKYDVHICLEGNQVLVVFLWMWHQQWVRTEW